MAKPFLGELIKLATQLLVQDEHVYPLEHVHFAGPYTDEGRRLPDDKFGLFFQVGGVLGDFGCHRVAGNKHLDLFGNKCRYSSGIVTETDQVCIFGKNLAEFKVFNCTAGTNGQGINFKKDHLAWRVNPACGRF